MVESEERLVFRVNRVTGQDPLTFLVYMYITLDDPVTHCLGT